MKQYTFITKLILITVIACLVFCCFTMTANAATKTADETKIFYGIHTDYGASAWGVRFIISSIYNNTSTSVYTAQSLSTSASIYPQHTYGNGNVIIAGIKETVDFGSELNRSIRPTASSFWSVQPLYVAPGTYVYYSYNGNYTKNFSYQLKEKGEFTFSVPDVFFPSPNATLILEVSGPK